MIKSVLSELKPEVKLILTNAIHFKGEWVEKFDKASTEESDFTLDNKTKTKVQMMQQTARFNYMENNDLQVLEMPYVGEEVSIMLLLPKEKSLQKLDSILSIKNISEWSSQLTEQEVHILIPKFKIETNYPMTDDLKSMGMPLAFSNQADFSKMTVNSKKLKIDQVIHKAVIDLDEKGTEAAATTTALMMWGSAALGIEKPIPIFRADHPFIFLIKHKENGSILFMGNFSNPNKI
jgi:serpin B